MCVCVRCGVVRVRCMVWCYVCDGVMLVDMNGVRMFACVSA